jgi:hypothetical protein
MSDGSPPQLCPHKAGRAFSLRIKLKITLNEDTNILNNLIFNCTFIDWKLSY